MKKITYFLLIVFGIFLIYNSVYQDAINSSSQAEQEDKVFEIEKGEGAVSVSQRLFEAELIQSEFFFKHYLKRSNLGPRLQAGVYSLNSMLSIREIVDIFVKGETINKEKEIKIIEGWKISDIEAYLAENKITPAGEFEKLARVKIGQWSMNFEKPEFLNLLPPHLDLEGFLFPDTYRIFNDASAEDIIEKMLKNFEQKIGSEILKEIRNQNKSLQEIVTMASIIEKEVRSASDMKMVSGIFWNRIESSHALESCATLAYILGVQKPIYSLEDTKVASPYNTYQNPGLPPGPISNPGLSAIQAAVYPTDNDYFYFLSRFDNGETVFSKTYDEHLNNKARYLK